MCDYTFPRGDSVVPSLDSLSIAPPNLDSLPPELIVVHVLPYLTNGEKGALAKTCGRLFRLLRHERVYRLSSPCTRKYLEDAAFREEVNSRVPAGKLVLRPFECALRALHFAPFEFKRARTLFEEALADESATELEKARSHLSLHLLHTYCWGGPCSDEVHWHFTAASAPLLLCAGDECDPVRAFEMGYCNFWGIGIPSVHSGKDKARSFFASSANGGCAAGVLFLGHWLYDGYGGAWDEPAASAQWERAAGMGHFGGMYHFGECLYGSGVPCDEARGVALIRSAAMDEGSWEAKKWLEERKDELNARGIMKLKIG